MLALRSGTASAEIALRGAELRNWRALGMPLLWNADADWWSGTSPILFPLVGRCRDGRYRIGGRHYAMDLHGFAAGRDFTLVRYGADMALLELADDATSRAHYPFAFRLRVAYRLRPTGLGVQFRVANPGPAPLPYAIGFHPGFTWPLGGGGRAAMLRFAHAEATEVAAVTERRLFAAGRSRRLDFDGRCLPLADDLFHDDALCWFDAKSRAARYEGPGATLHVAWRNLPHLALWSKPGAPFLCIEHWTAGGDAEDFAGEITEKPGIRLLPPGAAAVHAIRYRIEAGHG